METVHPILKKLQFKDKGQSVLILNAPDAYQEVMTAFSGRVDETVSEKTYDFIQVFGTSNDSIQTTAKEAVRYLSNDGLLYLCYPKKSSKTYKGSDCSRETVASLLAAEGFEPVRQIAIDDDWSALRFRPVEKIKTMVRDFAHTDLGKKRTGK